MKYNTIVICVLSLILFGCSKTNSIDSTKYEGRHLEIAVIGEKKLGIHPNVSFIHTELESLLQNKNTQYDALIITKDYFSEADKDRYSSFFTNLNYPVFFLGLEGYQDFAFTQAGVSLKNAKDDNGAYTQGFKYNADGTKQQWDFYLPNDSSPDESTDNSMLYRIFNAIN
ncbi:hypothetical protein IC620_16555 [Hazenella sp. IB182357]|uniref:Lipoprotein n=1 Tax=Polycladospora coralii TaxID=2771432 RepID=A0A926NEI6_9BACL|nr:hypothetical protein [Polycladospora coralii]MBD1373955.1 hypothetical protein [Polycladospora coralii]